MDGGAFAAGELRLKRYFHAARFIAVLALPVFGSLLYLFWEYFPYVRYKETVFASFVALFVYTAAGLMLAVVIHRKNFVYLLSLGWTAFYTIIIYATGGAESQFLFLYIIPLLTSAFDLNPEATRRVAIIETIIFAAMIFADPRYLADPVIVLKHLIRALVFGVIAFYMYKLVRETLRHKFEKEEADRKYLRLAEVDQVKSDFTMVVTHQLRTPLTGAKFGLAALLDRPFVRSEDKQIVAAALRRVEDGLVILDEMFKSLEVGVESFAVRFEDVDLAAIVTAVLAELDGLIKQTDVAVVTSLGTEPLIVRGDPMLLRLALESVLDNAVRYSPRGRVEIDLRRGVSDAILSVRDNGIGIHPDDLPHVFERFYRGSNALLLAPNETGIGLYISKRIIEKHYGTIALLSRLNAGTTVNVSIPLKRDLAKEPARAVAQPIASAR